MKTKFEMSYFKIFLLFFAGVIAGGAVGLTLANNMSFLSGSLEVSSMILILTAILISSRKLQKSE